MPRPTQRKGSTFKTYRKGIPTDLRDRAKGVRYQLTFPAMGSDPEVTRSGQLGRAEVTFSLGTREPAVAKARVGLAEAYMAKLFEELRRATPTTISHKDAHALAGEFYMAVVTALGDDPQIAQGVFYPKPGTSFADTLQIPTADALETRLGDIVDRLLAAKGLASVDPQGRVKILEALEARIGDAGATLRRYASGDYRPDPLPSSFPTFGKPAAPSIGPTWEQVISLWARFHEAAGKPPTIRREVSAFAERFAAFVTKPPAQVTPEDVQRWRDKRLADGINPITVGEKDLSQLRTIYRLAQSERLLSINPAEGVKVPKVRALAKSSGGGIPHSNAVLGAILKASLTETAPYRRWVPWLLATTGSRLSAVMNLRSCDVRQIEGVWCVEFTPEASQALKTSVSARVVPLHPALIAQGFPAFAVRVGGQLPLFYPHRSSRRGGGAYNPGKARGGHLRTWIHSLNLPGVGRQGGSDPCHGIRHWTAAAANSAGLPESVKNELCGFAGSTEGQRYGRGGMSMKAFAEHVARIRLPDLPETIDSGGDN